MGHTAAAAGAGADSDDDDDDDYYKGLKFDEILKRVKEKGERKKYSEEKVTDLLTKIVMEGFVCYNVSKPTKGCVFIEKNGVFPRFCQKTMASPSRREALLKKYADAAANKGIKRPLSQCPNKEEEVEEKKEAKRPRKSMMMEKKPITTKKSNVEKDQEKKKEKTNRFDLPALGLEPPPGLPEGLRRVIEEKGGTETTLVIMKQLFKTDRTKHHDRFSMPLSQIREGVKFLREDERELLKKSNDQNRKEYVPMNLLEPGPDHREKRGLALRQWNSNCECYVITTKWHEVVRDNNLKENDILQVWSFRVRESLWFVIVKVMDSEEVKRRSRGGGGHLEQQENGGGAAASSSHSGDQAGSDGDDGATTSLSGDEVMEDATEVLLYVSPNREQEDGDGATAKAAGQEQD